MIDQMGRWYPDYPGQQPQQDPQFMRMMGLTGQGQSNQNPQAMTPPTIHAEIIQYGSEDEVDRHPMAAGASQMFVSRDESTFIVKTMHQGGQFDKDYYDKRPPAPPKPQFDPDIYLTKDQVAEMIEAAVSARLKQAKEGA